MDIKGHSLFSDLNKANNETIEQKLLYQAALGNLPKLKQGYQSRLYE